MFEPTCFLKVIDKNGEEMPLAYGVSLTWEIARQFVEDVLRCVDVK